MKKYMLGLIFLTTLDLSAQSYISYNQIEIISYSITIDYSNGGDYDYRPNHYGSLRTRQAKYDYYHNMISEAWGSIKNANFINKQNQYYLIKKNRAVESDLRANNHYKHVDLSVNGSFANSYSKWITAIFNRSSVKAEIKLLNAIHAEYYRLKNDDPNNFHRKERYRELVKALDELESCSADQIGAISIKYGLW